MKPLSRMSSCWCSPSDAPDALRDGLLVVSRYIQAEPPRLGWRYTYVCLGGATADPSIESALPPVYAGGSTALKTISMSCSGKASLDTPIRLLAHWGRALE